VTRVLEALMRRVWGPRAGIDGLAEHLEATYGVWVDKLTALDNGVLRVDRADGPAWVARVFPADRPRASVECDAAVLAFLADQGIPAERCATDDPVSELHGQTVLVTLFVEGTSPVDGVEFNRSIGALVGRLHTLPEGPPATRRDAGALHLYTVEGDQRAELDNAAAWLRAVAPRATAAGPRALHEALTAEVAVAPDFAGLPRAIVHPDLVRTNVISSRSGLVPIDWSGTGRGCRVASLGMPLFQAGLAPGGWSARRLDAFAAGYREQARLDADEIAALAPAIIHRLLVGACVGLALGLTAGRPTEPLSEWRSTRALAGEMAAHAARVLGAP
jgi:Ser/Thr protein kinase RdoA (MazF antagonist)